MAPQIMTVLGPIEPEELGFTSMHEHTLLDGTVFFNRNRGKFPDDVLVQPNDLVSLENIGLLQRNFTLARDACSMRDEEWVTGELTEFKESGGQAVVDMSTPGLRCDVPGIRRISEKSGVHVIATTGLYDQDSWPEKYHQMTEADYVAYMLHEIENGIEDTDVKPGMIKISITDFSKQQASLLRAVGRVVNETGFSVTIDPGDEIGNDGRTIVKLLRQEGVNLERIVICHGDAFFVAHELRTLVLQPETWCLNTDYHKELFDQGANISIDCFGHQWSSEISGLVVEQDWQKLGGLVALLKAGYSPQIVLGTDTFLKILTRRGGGVGYSRLTNFVVPTLRDLGVSDLDIRRMTLENPVRLLAH